MQNEVQVAYCGLYCGDCFIKNSDVADKAKALADRLNEVHFERYANGFANVNSEFKPLLNYNGFYDALHSLNELRCEYACKQGGGSPSCKIRKCCEAKQIDGCWLCDTFESCETLAWLAPLHKGANVRNLRKIKSEGMQSFLEGEKYW